MTNRVDVEKLVDMIREADKPMTAGELAELYGVSRPAVWNYREELEAHPNIKSSKVGQATAFWWDPPDVGDTGSVGREGGHPPENTHVSDSTDESDSSEPRGPMMLPGVFLLMLAIIGPIYFLLALLDGTVLDRLRETLEVSTSEEQIQRTRYGRPGVYLAGLVAALGLLLGVAAGILVLDVGVGIAAWAVRVTLGLAGMTILGSAVAAYNAMPAWDENIAMSGGDA